MNIRMITREGCAFCEKAKAVLRINNIPFKEVMIDVDVTREQVLEEFPGRKTLPIIEIDGRVIGGYDDLTDYLINKQYGKGML